MIANFTRVFHLAKLAVNVNKKCPYLCR